MTQPDDEKASQQVKPDTPDSGAEKNRADRKQQEEEDKSLGQREFDGGSERD
jgi:hypothetical protein